MSKGVILWDIDGTLISTQRHFNVNLHQKVLKDCGFGNIKPDFETQGATDWEIISRLLSRIRYTPKENEIAEIIENLDVLSEKSDKDSFVLPMPGVSNLLKSFVSKFWLQGILTGNTRKRTFAKLEHASMANYFNHDYIFCCKINEKREDIAHRAEKYIVSQRLKSTVIVGDTPSDIAIAREMKAKVISVATGKFSKNELKLHRPDLLIENLEISSDKFYKFLKLVEDTIDKPC
jgi:phosphoglycolate phosphatase-like HAD superfamily hydrolase